MVTWTTTGTNGNWGGGWQQQIHFQQVIWLTEEQARALGFLPPLPPPEPVRDRRSKADKIRELAARATTPGEREAALIALAKLQGKEAS